MPHLLTHRQQRALDTERVHRAILEMEQVEDFENITRAIAGALSDLGLDFAGAGVNVIDEQAGQIRTFNESIAAGTMGLEEAQRLCRRLESAGKEGDLDAAPGLFSDLSAEFQASAPRLRTLKDSA